MNQKAGSQNGCKEQTRNVDEGIGSILEDLEAYICDKLCFCNNMKLTQEERDQHCSACQMHDKVDNIEKEYEEINNFGETAAYQLMAKYKRIVLCKECTNSKSYGVAGHYCVVGNSVNSLRADDGCSFGIRKNNRKDSTARCRER